MTWNNARHHTHEMRDRISAGADTIAAIPRETVRMCSGCGAGADERGGGAKCIKCGAVRVETFRRNKAAQRAVVSGVRGADLRERKR